MNAQFENVQKAESIPLFRRLGCKNGGTANKEV